MTPIKNAGLSLPVDPKSIQLSVVEYPDDPFKDFLSNQAKMLQQIDQFIREFRLRFPSYPEPSIALQGEDYELLFILKPDEFFRED